MVRENGGIGSALRKPFTVSSDIERALEENIGRIVEPILSLRESILEHLREMKTIVAQMQVDTFEEIPVAPASFSTHTRIRTTGFLIVLGVGYGGTNFTILRGNARLIGPMAFNNGGIGALAGVTWVPLHTIIEPSTPVSVTPLTGDLTVYMTGKAD